MPPVVAAAAITGITTLAGTGLAARSQSSANKRSLQATERSSARAEAFEREQDALNRADEARRDAEERRRYEVEQGNLLRKQQQEDALLKDNLERAAYEDAIRYGKMVKLARLTGQPTPPPLPKRTAGSLLTEPQPTAPVAASAPLLSRPSVANQAIAQPGAVDPFSQNARMPMSNLVGRRRVI